MDRLEEIFHLRSQFMDTLRESVPGSYPDLPIDLGDKKHQQFCRDLALRGVEEMFEALQHLKNWKPHRQTEIKDFDRDEFLEEVVDAFNYFLSLLIVTGHTPEDFFDAYRKKDKKIHERLSKGY